MAVNGLRDQFQQSNIRRCFVNLGEELDLVYQVKTPLQTQAPYTYQVIAGSYLGLASVGQSVGIQQLNDLKARLESTKSKLESQDEAQLASLTREDLLGDLFHAEVLGYFAEYNGLSHIMALQQKTNHSLAIGYGSYRKGVQKRGQVLHCHIGPDRLLLR